MIKENLYQTKHTFLYTLCVKSSQKLIDSRGSIEALESNPHTKNDSFSIGMFHCETASVYLFSLYLEFVWSELNKSWLEMQLIKKWYKHLLIYSVTVCDKCQ